MLDLTKKYKRSNFKRDCKKKGLNFEDYKETPAGRSGEGKGSYALFTYELVTNLGPCKIELNGEEVTPTVQIIEKSTCKKGEIIPIKGPGIEANEVIIDTTQPKTPKKVKKANTGTSDTSKPKLPKKLKTGLTAGTIKSIEDVLKDTPNGKVKKAIENIDKKPQRLTKGKKQDISFYEENSICRSDFKKTCKKNDEIFEDFEEIKDDYYVRPSGLRDMRYFYKRKVK